MTPPRRPRPSTTAQEARRRLSPRRGGARVEKAHAKVNLTLRVIGRRADGYHDIESLVVFAGIGDVLTFLPAATLALAVRGPTATASGAIADNLVLRAARALADRVEGIKLGRFALSKRLPVAAGLGGGSADAAAALRILACENNMGLDDPRLMQAAQATGADVPVCLEQRARLMRGIGDILSNPLDVPRLAAILVNPGVAIATTDVFSLLRVPQVGPARLAQDEAQVGPARLPHDKTQVPPARFAQDEAQVGSARFAQDETQGWPARFAQDDVQARLVQAAQAGERTAFLAAVSGERNDLEVPAASIAPVIGDVLGALGDLPGCRLARMSGSGATCFALFDTQREAAAAARVLRAAHPAWWVRPTELAG